MLKNYLSAAVLLSSLIVYESRACDDEPPTAVPHGEIKVQGDLIVRAVAVDIGSERISKSITYRVKGDQAVSASFSFPFWLPLDCGDSGTEYQPHCRVFRKDQLEILVEANGKKPDSLLNRIRYASKNRVPTDVSDEVLRRGWDKVISNWDEVMEKLPTSEKDALVEKGVLSATTTYGRSWYNNLEGQLILNDRDVSAELKQAKVDIDRKEIQVVQGQKNLQDEEWIKKGYYEFKKKEYSANWEKTVQVQWTEELKPARDYVVKVTYVPFSGILPSYVEHVSGKESDHNWKKVYCITPAEAKGITRKAKSSYETDAKSISVQLSDTEAAVEDFTLRIEKPGADTSIVSTCWDGLKKTGPKTFEFKAKNFKVPRNLEVAFYIAKKN
ncbi:MAG: DUF4424 family protein [Bdellovibrionales bacterium]|nr:DUF4424 family protein [Bdellovibrionales bacterium]